MNVNGVDAIITTSDCASQDYTHGAAWALTAALSPRSSVRVATRDPQGNILNQYMSQYRIADIEPDAPWAVYLADGAHQFHLLAFDFDAKAADNDVTAERDAEVISGFLHDVGMSSVVCKSGPSNGRHVWTALAEPVDAESVLMLARLARKLCPTLDLAPLSNPATGCVRPPGAPHRFGGRSIILSGNPTNLITPTGTRAQVSALIKHLTQLVAVSASPAPPSPARTLPLDEHGQLYLPGSRRPLPAGSVAALHENAATGDASAILWKVLIGAVAARWHYSDIAVLVDTKPGLEHIRTYRDQFRRIARSLSDSERVLRRQWDKAVRYVATTTRHVGDDPTFNTRANIIASHVQQVQIQADMTVNRWTHGGGPADRRVFDVLCMLSLQSLKVSVEADIRRLALLAGIGRETARTALLRLADDGWIVQTRAAAGPHGAVWSIAPSGVIHRDPNISRSQVIPRPPQGEAPPERASLLKALTTRTAAARHDLFTPGPGLGIYAGNVYARISSKPQNFDEINRATGGNTTITKRFLDLLTSVGVLIRTEDGWRKRAVDYRRTVAKRLNILGRLDDRARRYRIERDLWEWWQLEETWMRSPKHGTRPKQSNSQLTLIPEWEIKTYGAHPRKVNGRADYQMAKEILLRGFNKPHRSANHLAHASTNPRHHTDRVIKRSTSRILTPA